MGIVCGGYHIHGEGGRMKFFVIARHGLGDVLNGIFIKPSNRRLLSQLWAAMDAGVVEDAVLLYEEHYTAQTKELFEDIPFNLRVEPTRLLGENLDLPYLVAAGNNYMPSSVGDHLNIWEHGHLLADFDDTRTFMPCRKKPDFDLPENYILYCPFASAIDRTITHASVLEEIRKNTNLPVITAGYGEEFPGLAGDINRINKGTVPETLYLAEHSDLIIGAISWYRAFNSLFNKPVIEIYPAWRNPADVQARTIMRTLYEMAGDQYGMVHNLHCVIPMLDPGPTCLLRPTLMRYLKPEYIIEPTEG